MSGLGWLEYQRSRQLVRSDADFYALVAAAMARADTFNGIRLRAAFPDVWDALQRRYDAPGGLIDGEEMTDGMRAYLARAAG